MRFCLLLTLCLAISPLSVFANKVVGRVRVCQQKPIMEKPLLEKNLKEKATFAKPTLERIKLERVPSAIEGIRASTERPSFEKPQFDKSTYDDNCKPQKEPSNAVQRLLDQHNLPPEIARKIKDALKGKQTPQKPGECPCTATIVKPGKKSSN